jgi:outer membrane protein assembly factor BamB
VLVVDDEADTCELLRAVLTACGAEVRTAYSADAALSIVHAWLADVILSDVGMPEQDGYTFIAKVRASGIRTPAAALTAYARPADRVRDLESGFQAHLPKPAEPAELIALVASPAGGRRTPHHTAVRRTDAAHAPFRPSTPEQTISISNRPEIGNRCLSPLASSRFLVWAMGMRFVAHARFPFDLRKDLTMDRRSFLTAVLAAPVVAQTKKPAPKPAPAVKPVASAVPWTQWGGPNRNFQTTATGLKDTWPAAGPRVMWKRPLGEGYSAPVIEHDVLYTIYGKPREEVVIAANAGTGATIWEHTTPMSFASDAPEQGNGPYASPLIVGDRLFTTGVAGRLQCLDKKTGKLLWTQELVTTHGGSRLVYGYASSPIAFRDTVIVPVGGRGKSIMAFNQADGSIAWAKHDFGNVYSSPLLINVGGLEQAALLMDGAVIGVNPHNGDLQWQVPFKADYAIAIATPVWGPDNLLFVSAEYNAGAKVIELQRSGLETKATELWSSNRLRLHHGNAMRVGDAIYFSSGGKGSQAILSAVDARSGKILWQERSIQKASFVWADQKLITLAQDGALMIAYPSPQGFKITAKAVLLTEIAWTPPALVGTRVYLRDRRSLMAVDLA